MFGPKSNQILEGAMSKSLQNRKNESGQAVTEYILILAVALAFTILLSRTIFRSLDQGVLSLGAQMERDLRAGRGSVNAYVVP